MMSYGVCTVLSEQQEPTVLKKGLLISELFSKKINLIEMSRG